ncbi:hypothetical protein BDV59DRAFT_175277 [Aspergillus ambiguus]|uniref:uncharacterized protein n=1 Tax=Aspergillus ambiguus TaxID=176160 RepID=UPI003CCD004C
MKFSLAAVSSFVAASIAATLPEAFTLVGEGGNTVLTDGTHAIISHNVTDATTYPILVLHSSQSQVTYTRQGSPPTAWQNLYVIKDGVKPIAMTIPHSGATPNGALLSGFGMTDDGYFTFNGKQAFAVDPNAGDRQKIYYLGGDSQYQQAPLWVKECKGC